MKEIRLQSVKKRGDVVQKHARLAREDTAIPGLRPEGYRMKSTTIKVLSSMEGPNTKGGRLTYGKVCNSWRGYGREGGVLAGEFQHG